MKYIQEPEKKIPVIAETDVLVVGSGPSGLAAAIASARAGVDTMLVERHGCFGGNITQAMVESIGWYRHPKTVESDGIGLEFEAETKLALPPKNPPEAFTPSAPPTIPAMIAKMTTAPGVTPLLDRGKSCEFHHGASECALVLRVRNFMALILLQLCCD